MNVSASSWQPTLFWLHFDLGDFDWISLKHVTSLDEDFPNAAGSRQGDRETGRQGDKGPSGVWRAQTRQRALSDTAIQETAVQGHGESMNPDFKLSAPVSPSGEPAYMSYGRTQV